MSARRGNSARGRSRRFVGSVVVRDSIMYTLAYQEGGEASVAPEVLGVW